MADTAIRAVGGPDRPAPPHPPRLAWTDGGFLLLELPLAAPPPPEEGPAELAVEGTRLPPPLARFVLPGHLLVLARATPACREGALAEFRRGAESHALPLPAPGGLAEALAALPEPARLVLLPRLLATATVFRAGADPAYAALCHALAATLAATRPPARLLAGGAGDPFSAWRLPAPAEEAEGTWRLLQPGRPPRPVIAPEAGRQVLLLDGLPAPGSLLLPPAAPPLPLAAPPARLPSLSMLLRQKGAARAALLRLLARRAAGGDAAGAALLRDAQLMAPARATRLEDPALPVGGALELALPDGEGGVFLRGWLRDPLGLVGALHLRGPGGAVPLPATALHRLPRPELAERLSRAPQGDGGARPGFLARLEAAPPGAQFTLELHLASGQRLALTAPPGALPPATARDLVLSATEAAHATPALMEGCISPAAAALHRAAMTPGPAPLRLRLGAPAPARPAASLVIPLWRNLSFLPFQLAGFGRDPAFRGRTAPEIIYVLDSPEQQAELEARLRGLALLHDLPVTLLVQDRNRGYAPACNAGAAAATAPVLLFLNSDVVPDAPGWLGALLRRLARDARLAAVGPKLLHASGAIQHAGLFYAPAPDGGWGCNHYWKGFARHHPPACRARRVPAVTGAAMAVRRAGFEAVGGFATDYVLGDFEDSDLCLKLRAGGAEIGYEPAAELFHHERRSIAAHPGHAGTLAALHNRRLHAARWGGAIAALMRRHPHPGG